MLPEILKSLSGELESVSGKSLGDILIDTNTQIPMLRAIKDHCKKIGASAKNSLEREVALVIYFAAIAHGLVYQNVKISEYSYEKLEQSFIAISEYEWVTADLKKLFIEAKQYCGKKENCI